MTYSKKGQSFVEYIILLSVVAAALVGMKVYVQRSVQARVKDLTDTLIAANDPASHILEVDEIIPCLDGGLGTDACKTVPSSPARKKTESQISLRQQKIESGGAVTTKKNTAWGAGSGHTYSSQSHYMMVDDPEKKQYVAGVSGDPNLSTSGVDFSPTGVGVPPN